MALASDEATFNAAVDTLTTAWEAFTDAIAANEEIRIVFCAKHSGTTPGNSDMSGDLTAITYDLGRQYYVKNNPDNTDDNCFLHAGGHPLFWKLTNAAGDLA
jgi:hypothetical protein